MHRVFPTRVCWCFFRSLLDTFYNFCHPPVSDFVVTPLVSKCTQSALLCTFPIRGFVGTTRISWFCTFWHNFLTNFWVLFVLIRVWSWGRRQTRFGPFQKGSFFGRFCGNPRIESIENIKNHQNRQNPVKLGRNLGTRNLGTFWGLKNGSVFMDPLIKSVNPTRISKKRPRKVIEKMKFSCLRKIVVFQSSLMFSCILIWNPVGLEQSTHPNHNSMII